MKHISLWFVFSAVVFLSGCQSTYNAGSVSPKDLAKESTLVVVRPDRYTLLGTRSMRDYLEITYDELSRNKADMPVVRVGVRNKGGEHWWDLKAPNFTLYAQAVFYRNPVKGQSSRSAPLYRTNKQAVPMRRGETADLKFTCPVKEAEGYQVIFSEK